MSLSGPIKNCAEFLMTIPLLSIIVPVSNMASRMHNLKSWIDDSQKLPIEVILVHDFKDQKTQDELEEISKKYCNLGLPVSIFKVNFGNPGETRNFGLSKSTGQWIQFVDADDLVHPKKSINAIKEALDVSEIIITNFQTYNLKTKIEVTNKHCSSLSNVIVNPGLWRFIFRKETLSTTKFTKNRMGEDQLFLLDLQFLNKSIEFNESVTYTYFIGVPNQLTSQKKVIMELANVTKELHSKLIAETGVNRKYLVLMYIRQNLTLAKKSGYAAPIVGLIFASRIIRKLGLGDLKHLPKAMFLIWKND
jgi:glycosyltransferase involved in cell wall biosynthesis